MRMFTVLTNAQTPYLNLIGQNKSIQSYFWPTSSTTSDWSNIGHKNLFLTSLLETSGRLQIEVWKTPNQQRTHQKSTASSSNELVHDVGTHYIFIWLNNIYLFLTHPVHTVNNSAVKTTAGHKTVLMTASCPLNNYSIVIQWIYKNNQVYIMKSAPYY